jgi:hypothetical protein
LACELQRVGSVAERGDTRPRGGRRTIVPGRSGGSEIIKWLLSSDPDEVMPPKDSHREVTAAQIEVLQRWIDGGAAYAAYSAFVAPKRPEIPKVRDERWVKKRSTRSSSRDLNRNNFVHRVKRFAKS